MIIQIQCIIVCNINFIKKKDNRTDSTDISNGCVTVPKKRLEFSTRMSTEKK